MNAQCIGRAQVQIGTLPFGEKVTKRKPEFRI